MQAKEDASEEMAVVKGVDEKIKAASEGVEKKKEEVDSKLRLIGNIVHDSVPDSNNEVLKQPIDCVCA